MKRVALLAGMLMCGCSPMAAAQASTASDACATGDQVLAAGQWQEAADAYQVCVRTNESFAVYANMGVALSHLGRMDEAIADDQKALTLEPKNTQVEFNLVVALVKAGSYEPAVEHLRHLDRDGHDARYEELLAFCYFHLGSYGLAQRAAERVYAEHPENAGNALILGSIYTHTGQYAKALPLITMALQAAGSAEGHMILAQTLIGMHRYPEAAAELDQVASENPTFPGLHEARGEVLVGTEHSKEAEAEFAKALSQDPNDFEANYFMGRLERFDGDFPDAKTYLNRADHLQPGSTQVAYERAEIAIKQQRFADAVPLLERVIAAEPDEAQAYLLLAKAYQRTGRLQDAQREGQLYNEKREASHALREAQAQSAGKANP